MFMKYNSFSHIICLSMGSEPTVVKVMELKWPIKWTVRMSPSLRHWNYISDVQWSETCKLSFRISLCSDNENHVRSLSPQHGASSGCRWRNSLQLWMVAANILNKQLQTNNRQVVLQLGGWSWDLQTPVIKNKPVTKHKHEPQTWTNSLGKWYKQKNNLVRRFQC
jgi:hypothetical protein